MKVTFIKVFNRKKKLNEEGKAIIEIMAYQDRKRKYISTKIFIRPDQWDDKHRVINKKHPQMDELNSQIEEMIKRLEKQQAENFYQDKPFTIENVEKTTLESYTAGSFIEFMRSEIEKNKEIKKATKASHTNTLNKLEEFKKTDIQFAELNYSFVKDFLNYLRGKNLAHNTVHKQHKNLKIYIDIAIKHGYIKSANPCKEVRIQYKQTQRDALTIEEIKAIEELDLTEYDDKIKVVRDMFLFACYTGLRISDVTHLKPAYIKKDKDGYSLKFRTIKAEKWADLPLYNLFREEEKPLQSKKQGTQNAGKQKKRPVHQQQDNAPKKYKKESKPEKILKKYYDEKKELVFPDLSEPFINRVLKVIAALAKIKINLTFHVARHSFGTYLAVKIPLPHLRELMQHSDITTTMIYVDVNMEQVKKELKRVIWE
jgi:site-specific recombinase XerD